MLASSETVPASACPASFGEPGSLMVMAMLSAFAYPASSHEDWLLATLMAFAFLGSSRVDSLRATLMASACPASSRVDSLRAMAKRS
jgi:hypothetical protein